MRNNYSRFIYLVRILADVTVIVVSYYLTVEFLITYTKYAFDTNAFFLLFFLLFIWMYSTKVTGLYDEFRGRYFSEEIVTIVKNVFILAISTIVILFLLKDKTLSRQFVVMFVGVTLIMLTSEKYLLRINLEHLRKKGRNLRHLLIIGAGNVGKNFYESIKDNPHFGFNIVGFVDDEKKTFLNGKYLGKIKDLDSVLDFRKVDDVIIALPNYASDTIESVVRTCERYTIRVRIIPDYFKFVSSKYNISLFGNFPVVSVREDKINDIHWRLLKRGFDTGISLFLFIFVFSWLWPIIAISIKLTSRGRIFYKQERWGRDNRMFTTYKFRSMTPDSVEVDEEGNFVQVTKDDPRVTSLGRFLRKSNLDELPQFWNVLKGEMSLVGPRPHPTPLNIQSRDKIRLYMLRHLVKPGITGWAQVNGFRGETNTRELMQKRIDHDIWYIENWSVWLDIQILFLTLWKMVQGDPKAY